MATIIRKSAPETPPNDDEEHEEELEEDEEDEMGEVDPVATKRRKDRKDIWGRDRSKLSRKVQLPPGMQKLENADWLKMTPQDRLKYFSVPSECCMSGFIISYPYYDTMTIPSTLCSLTRKMRIRLCAFRGLSFARLLPSLYPRLPYSSPRICPQRYRTFCRQWHSRRSC